MSGTRGLLSRYHLGSCGLGSVVKLNRRFERRFWRTVEGLRAEARKAWFFRPRKVGLQFQLRLPREADSPSASVLCSQTTAGGAPLVVKHLSSREHGYPYPLPDSLTHSLLPSEQVLAKILGNELGNREGLSFSSNLTTLLYSLIHSLLSLLTPAKQGSKE